MRKVYKCFISSPGDCDHERDTCIKVVENVNNRLAKHLGLTFETFMWEYDVLPDMGMNGQEIIDEYVSKSNYDIFIGIMKNRFGQPTKKAGSGTEHEFNDALRRKLRSSDSLPRIIFFFGKENVDPDQFDFSQFQRVKEFKSQMGNNGIYTEFTDLDTFEKKLTNHLELFVKDHSPLDQLEEKIKNVDFILRKLERDLNDSLTTYNEKCPVWIEPIISSKRDVPENPTKNDDFRIKMEDIIEAPQNVIIKAPSEFGLTSLAHHLKLEAWKIGKTFLYIDSKKTKKHRIVKDIYTEVQDYYYDDSKSIDCILLDSVCLEENGIMQMIKNLCDGFPDVPLIIFNTLDNNFFLKSDEDDKIEISRKFTSYYLLPLPQKEVRKIVKSYSSFKSLEEDSEIILHKVTKDLETLNMHRTVKNCISILRACSRIGSEYSPVNRTKLLETLLFTIFEEYEVPTYYDKKPDVKDCSFVLGYFCEILVLRNSFEFTREFFIIELKKICTENFIELDLEYLINVLIDNSIIVCISSSDLHYFKNSYWVFYFLAHRMNMNKDFLQYVYENKKYIDFPALIEFYTGIDRNKEDAIQVLYKDLEETLLTVRSKVNIPDSINPYKSISWNPDIETLLKEEAKISENVLSSGLPDEVKDKYDDKQYNQIRPYNQVINSVMRDYSFLVLMRQISAASRALRNSDFVNPNIKKELLNKIIQCWSEVGKILIVLSPLLADKGSIAFEGANFYLDEEDFRMSNIDEKRLAVLLAVPTNVVKFFKDDLYSSKMGPLLIDKAKSENNSLLKHELMLLMIAERPKGWNKIIDNYIVKLDKNSFFLSDILSTLSYNIEYKNTEISDKRLLIFLASKCRAKHIFKNNNPDLGLINRLKKLDSGTKY